MVNFIKNDFGFNFAFAVKDANADAINLTGSTVTFKMSKIGNRATKVTGICTISDATNGLCYYTFADGDLDTIGEYSYELQIMYATKTITARSVEMVVVTNDLR